MNVCDGLSPYIICGYPSSSDIFISVIGILVSVAILMLEIKRRSKETDQSKINILQHAYAISDILDDIYRNGKGIDKDDEDNIEDGENGSYYKKYLLSKYDVLRRRYDDLNLIFNLAKFKKNNYYTSAFKILYNTDWVLNDYIIKIKNDDSLENMQKLYVEFCDTYKTDFSIHFDNIKKYTKDIHVR